MMFKKTIILIIACIMCVVVGTAHADAAVYPATVVSAGEVQEDIVEEVNYHAFTQDILVAFTRGPHKNDIVPMNNDFAPFTEGQNIFVRVDEDEDGSLLYAVYTIDRSGILFLLLVIFVVTIIVFGGRRGVRSLASLVASILVIFYILMPLISAGHSPMLWGVVIAISLLGLVMVMTHGLRPKTYAAFLGTSIAVALTSIMTFFILQAGHFSGLGTEEAFGLMTAGKSIDMIQLLFVGIIIGMLGVLDDVAITQAAVVMELKSAGVRGKKLYTKALRVGHEHVGALVNTLVLAYAGAALPLFLLLATFNEPLLAVMSIEIIATEIIRALVGSIGIILAVPLTTLLATFFMARDAEDMRGCHAHQ